MKPIYLKSLVYADALSRAKRAYLKYWKAIFRILTADVAIVKKGSI